MVSLAHKIGVFFMRSKWMWIGLILIAIALLIFFRARKNLPVKVVRAPRYNLLLISIDTTRSDFLGCYGNRLIATPNLDSLAEQGVLFEDHYSAINTTAPSHSSMFTGLYPRNHGVGRNGMRLNAKNLTLAEFLSAKGYTTAAFIGSYAIASVFGLNQGFEVYDESFVGDAKSYVIKNLPVENNKKEPMEVVLHHSIQHYRRKAEEVNASFFHWLDSNQKTPFFVFVHYYDPHFPYEPEPKWYEKHLKTIPPDTPFTNEARDSLKETFSKSTPLITDFRPAEINNLKFPEPVRALLNLYLSQIEYCDHAIGQIIAKLKAKNLLDHTVVVVTADHGENLLDHWDFHSYFTHGTLTFEPDTHVPLIITCPNLFPNGKHVKTITSEIDLFPTLVDLLNLNPSPSVDGKSFLANIFSNNKIPVRTIYAEATHPYASWRNARSLVWVNDLNSASVRADRYKYVKDIHQKFEGFYEIEKDPTEQENLLTELLRRDPGLVERMRRSLQDWRSKALVGNVDTSFDLSEEDREKLKSLGYVQ
jgi:arylsulfatase A-like enzyme